MHLRAMHLLAMHLRTQAYYRSGRTWRPAPSSRQLGEVLGVIGAQHPPPISIVAVDAFTPFVALLRLDRERGDRARFKPLQGNRLAGLLAVAVGTIVDAGDGGID